MMTRKDAVVTGLLALGYKPDYSRQTTKYRCYSRGGLQVLIGRSGAVRIVKPEEPLTASISWTDTPMHRDLELVGRAVVTIHPESPEALQAWAEAELAR